MDESSEYDENNPDPDPDCDAPGPRPPSGSRLVDGETGGEGRQRWRGGDHAVTTRKVSRNARERALALAPNGATGDEQSDGQRHLTSWK